jgi:hypothetical protein
LNRSTDPINQLAIAGDSRVEWCEDNFQDDDAHTTRRPGIDATIPHRINHKKFGR